MSRTLLASNEADRLDLHFPANTAHGVVLDLCNAIADLKFSVEYTNATVSDDQRQTLLTVMELWWEACEALCTSDEKTARRFAEVGLLLLNISVLNINLYNEQETPPVLVRKTFSNPLFARIREFAEQLSEAYNSYSWAQDTAPPQAKEHLTGAIKNLNDTMGHLVAGDDNLADVNVAAGLMDLKYVQRLTPVVNKAKGVSAQKPNPIDVRKLRELLAVKLQAGRNHAAAHNAVRPKDRKAWSPDAKPLPLNSTNAIDTYNRIVDLGTSTLEPAKMQRVLSNLQNAVHFFEQAKRRTDLTFATELCEQALTDLAEARTLVFD
jgi:hypothetical protein